MTSSSHTSSPQNHSYYLRQSEERGLTKTDWLNSRHSFSFGNYQDPEWTGFRTLKVLNEDHVAPNSGFGTHGHKDMEILSYVVSGTLSHKDSASQSAEAAEIPTGSFQLMTAGSGIEHSEMNESPSDPVHFLQIWIEPNQQDLSPGHQELAVSQQDKENTIKLVASPDGDQGSLKIHQDAWVYATLLRPGQSITIAVQPGRHFWAQLISGSCTVNEHTLDMGDGLGLSDSQHVTLTANESVADLLLFDLS